MSNTGLKGISYQEEKDRYLVCVGWKKKELRGVASALPDAVSMRDDFERRLRKPRTERRIISNCSGLTEYYHKGNRTWVISAYATDFAGTRRHRDFYFRPTVASRNRALGLATAWRKKMSLQFYGVHP